MSKYICWFLSMAIMWTASQSVCEAGFTIWKPDAPLLKTSTLPIGGSKPDHVNFFTGKKVDRLIRHPDGIVTLVNPQVWTVDAKGIKPPQFMPIAAIGVNFQLICGTFGYASGPRGDVKTVASDYYPDVDGVFGQTTFVTSPTTHSIVYNVIFCFDEKIKPYASHSYGGISTYSNGWVKITDPFYDPLGIPERLWFLVGDGFRTDDGACKLFGYSLAIDSKTRVFDPKEDIKYSTNISTIWNGRFNGHLEGKSREVITELICATP